MTASFAILTGVLAAAFLAAAFRPRPSATRTGRPVDPLARELGDLRDQFEAGELEVDDYHALRERLAARVAVGEAQGNNAAPPRGRWRLPAAGALAGAVIVAALVPALRQRGEDEYITGNDFSAAGTAEGRDGVQPGLAELQQAEFALRKGDAARAAEGYRTAVAFYPDEPVIRARFGFALALSGRPGQALTQLRLAAREEPRLAVTHFYLGAALLRAGDERGATREWRRYLALTPGDSGEGLVRRALEDVRGGDRLLRNVLPGATAKESGGSRRDPRASNGGSGERSSLTGRSARRKR